MLNIKVIGTGAAGNKAVINSIEKRVLKETDTLLVNSVKDDIPEKYQKSAFIFQTIGGCGKEAAEGEKMAHDALNTGSLKKRIDSLVTDSTDMVVIIPSLEGGTGSGSSTVIGNYIDKELQVPVVYMALAGFLNDARGLQNTIRWFQHITNTVEIQAISNRKFLDCSGNFLKAEEDANDEVAFRLKVLQGLEITKTGKHVIDSTDLYKGSFQTGFASVMRGSLENIKNQEQFNQLLLSMTQSDNSIDLPIKDKTIKNASLIVNLKESRRAIIDQTLTILQEEWIGAEIYEKFVHIQYDENQPEEVILVVQGLSIPLDFVKEVDRKYKEKINSINVSGDNFFSEISSLGVKEEKPVEVSVGTRRRRRPTNVVDEAAKGNAVLENM